MASASDIGQTVPAGTRFSPAVWLPLAAVLLYPFLLSGFHQLLLHGGTVAMAGATLLLMLACAVPLAAFFCGWRSNVPSSLRRFSYAVVAAPTLYVFLGVLTTMLKIPVPDPLIWSVLWLGLAGVAWASAGLPYQPAGETTRWRVVHGITALLVVAFVLFHIINHLFGLESLAAHDRVRKLGEVVYRQPLVEPLLALLLLFQVVTGLRLFWRWSAMPHDFYRSVQVATGIFLAAYLVGHMDSVFVYARSYIGTTTSFFWAAGAEAGLLADAWNIRLVPHYFLAVFFVLIHLAAGARAVALAHGAPALLLNRLWLAAATLSLMIATLIMLAMVGIRL